MRVALFRERPNLSAYQNSDLSGTIRSSWFIQRVRRDEDVERQAFNNDGVDSKEKKTTTKTFLDPEGQFLRIWRMIFVVSCMMAVSVDPLFFYLPVINEKNKCFVIDERLRVVAICLRTATDLIYVVNIVFQFLCPYVDEAARKLGRMKVVTDSWPIAKRYFLSRYFPIDILAILPLPQVLIPIIFSEIRGSESLHKRRLLNTVVLYQYVPRLIRTANKHSRVLVRVKAALNLFMYIMASHVLGAFWYFLSIERETICWHSACEKNYTACTPNSFNCHDHVHSSGNYTFMNDYCPVETKDGPMPFDFGIYHDAIKSGIVASRNLPKKILYCSWWGLRNLSSFGQNLQTSTNFWENGFAIFISILGLLLFLYFIGKVQTYMQLTTERKEIIQKMKSKEREIELWISRNGLNDNIKRKIMANIQRVLEHNIDVDAKNPLPHLPKELTREIKCHLCLPLLKKVPMLETESERLLQLLCYNLKLVYYNERSYIVREGEPLDAMLFITQGIVCNFGTSTVRGDGSFSLSVECIERGHFFGEEHLDWGYRGSPITNLSDLPISIKTFKTHTKVEAFALMANDLRTLISWWQTESKAAWRRFRVKKNSEIMSAHLARRPN